jgi:hypothetical protein
MVKRRCCLVVVMVPFMPFSHAPVKSISTYDASTRGINVSPLAVNGTVYGSHAEQNLSDTTILGALFAFDGRTEGKIAEDKLLWKVPAKAVGRSSPVYADGRLYYVEDGGTLFVVMPPTARLSKTKRWAALCSAAHCLPMVSSTLLKTQAVFTSLNQRQKVLSN